MSMRLGLGLGLPRRGRGTSAWTPASLFGAGEEGAWFDPSDLSTVWQDAAGTVPGAVNSPVGRLDDKSGYGNHLSQATAGERPMLRSDGSLYWLERDGNDDRLLTSASFTLEAGWTLAAAASFAAGSDITTASILALEKTGTDFFVLGFRQSIEQARTALRGPAAVPSVNLTTGVSAVDAYPDGTPAVLTSRFQALSHDIRLNGTTRDTEATTWDTQVLSGMWLVFGRVDIAPVVPVNLYAAVALKRIPSTGELEKLESWLAAKSGVTL